MKVKVVREVNANGAWDQVLEPGMAGVTVTLTDDAGTSISGVTIADGTVTLAPAGSALVGGKYRVQVINPKPGVLYSAFADRTGLTGAPNKLSSTEEFVDVSAGKNISYTTAFWNPGDYCQKNATLVTACIRNDITPEAATSRTLVSFPYNARGDNNQTTNIATHAQTGSLYGIGYSKQKKWIFAGAHAHRGSKYGTAGNGAIYLSQGSAAKPPVFGAPTLFTTVPGAGSTAHDFATNTDLGFAPAAGKEALGDVEVSEDGKDLYVVNLADRKLYRYDATQTTAASAKASYAIPGPDTACPAAGDWRPYALGVQDGVVYVGGVCSGESTQKKSDMRAIVRTFDPVAGTFGSVIMDQKLDFPRAISFESAAYCTGASWYPWTDKIPLTQDGKNCPVGYYANPEPILADIIVDTDGSLILGFRDRLTDQTGQLLPMSPGGGLYQPAAGGSLSRACAGSDGMFVMAENNACGKTVRGTNYYYNRTYWEHGNGVFAGAALSKVEDTIATSAIDPIGTIFSGGTVFVDRDGSDSALNSTHGNLLTTSFGKGGSMADLEVLCDEAPLQIGNRVWYDVDKDGIQDPGENPVPGATVNLYEGGTKLVGTMKTTARGEYYFDDSNVTGGLKPNTAYTIKVDNPVDYAAGGPLFQWVVTQANAGTNDFIDSDGTVPAGATFPEYAITTGGPGQDNHTYDFGYNQPDGMVTVLKQDQDGKPLAGAEFQLWKETNTTAGLQTAGTTPDSKVGTVCTTAANGSCSSTVPLNTYYWEETKAPVGHLTPSPAVFGPMTLTFANYQAGITVNAVNELATGEVRVLKKGSDGKILAGAIFQLWKETNGTAGLQLDGPSPDTTVGTPCTTPVNGTCVSPKVPLGTYYWQETQAPDGYLMPDPAVFGPLDLTMANRVTGVNIDAVDELATGVVKVLKKDQDGNALAGAVFQLWKETNGTAGLQTAAGTPDTVIGTPCTTPANGTCESAKVPLGTYYWQETKAPDAYLMPDPAIFGPLTLTMANRIAGVTTEAVNELAKGEVSLQKNGKDGKPLAGGVFQLWRETNATSGLQIDGDTKVGAPCTTPANGRCAATVPLGTYYWQETKAPDGHLLPDPAIFGPLTLTMANRTAGVTTTAVNELATGEVKVVKKDQNGKPLAGAIFQLWKETNGTADLQTGGSTPDTAQGAPCTTPSTGICSVVMPLGTYYWQETQAPDGYLLPDPATFGPLTLTMANRVAGVSIDAINELATGEVKVVKKDQDGKPLAGATFQLWKETNNTADLQINADTKVGTVCTTPATGICADVVPLGTYYWQETKAPDAHLLPDPAIFGPLTLTMANRIAGVSIDAVNVLATGEVKVVKKDQNGKPLAGAIFQLWNTPLNTKVGDPCTTPADGVCSAVVPLGTYHWEETQAPDGYLLPDPATFGPLTLTMANRTAGVSIDAVNELATGEVRISKQDKAGKALAGAEFQLWRETNGTDGLQVDGAPADTKVAAICTTAAAGDCASAKVPLGVYYWQETKAPDGHLLSATAIYGPLNLTMATRTAGVTINATNELATGEVKVVKKDQDGKPLAGAIFQLWQEDNGNPLGVKVGNPCTTPADGVCSAVVPLGTYYWEETQAPDGYLLPSPATFGPLTLTMANRIAGLSADATNIQAIGEVKVVKKSKDGSLLAGAEFQLWKEANGNPLGTKVGAVCTTPANGVCSAAVPVGTYYWQETKAPAGHALPIPAIFGPLELTVANHTAGVSVDALNEPGPGDVRVIKQDLDGKPLSGAMFQLWRETNGSSGLQVDGPTPDAKVGALCTTDADGLCKFSVALATYYWEEVKAPNGYRLPNPAIFGPLELTLANQSQGVEVTVANELQRADVRLLKRSKDDGTLLAGAAFELWRETNGVKGLQADDTLIGDCVTDAQGACDFPALLLGEYYLGETKAPDGYVLPTVTINGPYALTEAHVGKPLEITVKNSKKPDLPVTGASVPVFRLVGASLASILIGALVIVLTSKRRRQ